MVNKQYQVVWTKRSQQHLKAAHKYISLSSPQNALNVTQDIVTSLNKAISNPEFYGPTNTKQIMMAATVHLKNIITG